MTVKVSNCLKSDLLVRYPAKPIGVIRSTRTYYYSNNANCTWSFSSNTKLHLVFSRFTTQYKGDYLAVYDGNTTYSRPLGKFSGSSFPLPVTSNSTQLYARFITDGSGVERGFLARYAGILSTCVWRCILLD